MQILIVEDEPKIAQFLRRGLLEEHYAVDLAADDFLKPSILLFLICGVI